MPGEVARHGAPLASCSHMTTLVPLTQHIFCLSTESRSTAVTILALGALCRGCQRAPEHPCCLMVTVPVWHHGEEALKKKKPHSFKPGISSARHGPREELGGRGGILGGNEQPEPVETPPLGTAAACSPSSGPKSPSVIDATTPHAAPGKVPHQTKPRRGF